MYIRNLKLTTQQIAGNNEGQGVLINIRPGYDYENGVRTNRISHIKYDTIFEDNLFERVTVKIEGTVPLIARESLIAKGNRLHVRFTDLSGTLYQNSRGEWQISATATNIEIIN